MFDDDAPRPKREFAIGQKLDEFSVAELDAVLVALKSEILRVEAARIRKAGHLSAADALFTKK